MGKLDHFIASAYDLDPRLAIELEDSIFQVTKLLGSRKVSEKKKLVVLKQLQVYIQKKCGELDPRIIEDRDADLKSIRNSVAHGRMNPDLDTSYFYPELWSSILHLSNNFDPYEMENILVYAMDVPNEKAALMGASSDRIVKLYRDIFSSFDSEKKRKVFSELLLLLFSDQKSLSYLTHSVKK